MSDERRDDEIIGRALARAIETIDMNETPYERSRMVAPPPGRGFQLWQLGAAAAALVLALAVGSWFTRPTEDEPGVAASPTVPAATTVPATTPIPTATVPSDRIWVYFARDGLPPIGAFTVGIFDDRGPESRIGSRLSALRSARTGLPAGATNAFAEPTPTQSGSSSFGMSIQKIQGDLATVEFDFSNGWGVRGSAESLALIQQLVYTITEEPGIHRALITEKGKPNAVIDQLVVDKPLTREDVFGYSLAAKPDKIEDGGMGSVGEIADWRVSVDQVSPGLGRFVIEFKPQPGAPENSTPKFVAQLERPQQEKRAEDGKWVIRVTLPDALWNQPAGEAFHCCPLKIVGKTPIIEAAAYPLTGEPPVNGLYKGVGFGLILDDARPWRATVLQNPTRLVIDVGGTPQYVSDRIAFYSMQPGSTSNSIAISGAARVFEANVVWRVKDQTGKVVANGHFLASLGSSAVWGTFNPTIQLPLNLTGGGTLELFEVSPRDGSEQGLVQIPLSVR